MGKPRKWTEEEYSWIADHVKGIPVRKLTEQFNECFGTDVSYSTMRGFLARKKLKCGIDGRFQPGHEWVGIKGTKPAKTHPIGTEQVMSNGYIYVKTSEVTMGSIWKNWTSKHVLIYEQHYGKVPEGSMVVFVDGDKRNFNIDNLMAVPRRAFIVFQNKYGYTGNTEIDKANWLRARIEAECNYIERKKGSDANGQQKNSDS